MNNFESNKVVFLNFWNILKLKKTLQMVMWHWHACLGLDMTNTSALIAWSGVSLEVLEVFIKSQHSDPFNTVQRINSSSQEQQVIESMFGLVFVRDYSWGFGASEKSGIKKECGKETRTCPDSHELCAPFNHRLALWEAFNHSFAFAWQELSTDTWPVLLLHVKSCFESFLLCQFPKRLSLFLEFVEAIPCLTFHVSCNDLSLLLGTKCESNISKYSSTDNKFLMQHRTVGLNPAGVDIHSQWEWVKVHQGPIWYHYIWSVFRFKKAIKTSSLYVTAGVIRVLV